MNNVSAVSGFCKKCNDFRKRYCGGDRNTCMTILFDRIEVLQHENNAIKNCLNTAEKAIEALQQENEQLRKKGEKDENKKG